MQRQCCGAPVTSTLGVQTERNRLRRHLTISPESNPTHLRPRRMPARVLARFSTWVFILAVGVTITLWTRSFVRTDWIWVETPPVFTKHAFSLVSYEGRLAALWMTASGGPKFTWWESFPDDPNGALRHQVDFAHYSFGFTGPRALGAGLLWWDSSVGPAPVSGGVARIVLLFSYAHLLALSCAVPIVTWSVARWRRTRRARHGLCVDCRHPIATGRCCPECGALQPPAVRSVARKSDT